VLTDNRAFSLFFSAFSSTSIRLVVRGGRARRPVALVQNLMILALHPFWGIDPLCRKDVHLYQIWPPLPLETRLT
ncbi:MULTISPECIES: hypothetical protein, partial [unclassified Neglectibacter]|uniref:hypothetical protein n=1 Tax=unclassified Neglectibacter TaxID=2632164 RepID=UPI001A9AC768